MTDEIARALQPHELAALRLFVNASRGPAPPLDTVAFLLRRKLIKRGNGIIEITQAGRDVLAADSHIKLDG